MTRHEKQQPILGLRNRVVIENVRPQVDCGRFPIKRIIGERVVVTADIHADGHDELVALVLHRPASDAAWRETPMAALGNDAWRGEFSVASLETHFYSIESWIDLFRTWQRDVAKKAQAGDDVSVELLAGAEMIAQAAARASGPDRQQLAAASAAVRERSRKDQSAGLQTALNPAVTAVMHRYPDRELASRLEQPLAITVDRERARFGAWYEMFPRSCAPEPGRHGTFRDCVKRLDYIAGMGFDVLYFPPIHPIGRAERKGKNNNPVCQPGDVGSPWAIGAAEGGHKSIHPDLGTIDDFRHLMGQARNAGLEVALDIALHCTPDHPYVKEHRNWFRERPDGTVQYAENPPKKYQDIYPLNFETTDAAVLWQELLSIFLYWAEQGVRIFRVDNPHTKSYAFWQWAIAEVKRRYPEAIFLSEAFTRPKVMYRLAKLGFTQSYTYFTWRNNKWELADYFTELTQSDVREFFRPNLWPNTPDILNEYLQTGGRPAFMTRFVLAATLGASYGIYGPAFELCENRPLHPGSEEYLNSEKYEIRRWDIQWPDSLRDLIAKVNRIRRENPSLHTNQGLRFHAVDNDQLLAYSKATEDLSNIILVVVNLDANYKQSGWIDVPLDLFQLEAHRSYEVHDLLTDARYLWQGPRSYVEIDPGVLPAHIFRVRRHIRTEQDVDYYR